jgi:uridine phosphorylase
MATLYGGCERKADQNLSKAGPAITRNSMPSNWPDKRLASSDVQSARPFAVLIAEELFESGCRLLLSMTSAGQIVPMGPTPYFVIIDRALRDEGTSYHYAEPSEYGEANAKLVAMAVKALKAAGQRVIVGPTWTTDAPFRETAQAIEAAKRRGILAVEMEAAALYTLAKVRPANVLCIAHVTNTMGQTAQDFEKGEADGTADAMQILEAIVQTREPQL